MVCGLVGGDGGGDNNETQVSKEENRKQNNV